MTPSDQYAELLSSLTAARSTMLSVQWQSALDAVTQAERVAAGNALIQLQSAILSLANESLSDLATQMQNNEQQLAAATSQLNDVIQNFQEVENVLDKVADVLTVVSKILPIL